MQMRQLLAVSMRKRFLSCTELMVHLMQTEFLRLMIIHRQLELQFVLREFTYLLKRFRKSLRRLRVDLRKK